MHGQSHRIRTVATHTACQSHLAAKLGEAACGPSITLLAVCVRVCVVVRRRGKVTQVD